MNTNLIAEKNAIIEKIRQDWQLTPEEDRYFSLKNIEECSADLAFNSFENQNIKQKLIGYFLQKEQDHNGQGTTYITILNYLGVPITEAMVRKWIDCRSNAVGEYNIPPVLNNCTAWSDEEKLIFYKKLPPKLQNKEEIKKLEMKISK